MSIRVPFLSSMSTLVAFCWRCRLEKCRCADSDLHISPLAHRSFSHLHTLKLLRFFRALTLLAQQSRYSVGKKKELLNKSIVRMCDSDGGPRGRWWLLYFFSPLLFFWLWPFQPTIGAALFFFCARSVGCEIVASHGERLFWSLSYFYDFCWFSGKKRGFGEVKYEDFGFSNLKFWFPSKSAFFMDLWFWRKRR